MTQILGLVSAKEKANKMYCNLKYLKIRLAGWLFCFLLIGFCVPKGAATSIQFDFNHEFSSGTPPAGTAPWLRAIFTDVGVDTVSLKISAVNLSPTEFVSGWYFNLDPLMNANNLVFGGPAVNSGAVTSPGIQTGKDKFKADGDGKYDILFSFATSGGATERFTAGDSITFTLSGILGLTADDFNFLSAPAGGHGPFISAAHVQGIGGGLSGWVDPILIIPPDDTDKVPDGGSTIVLLGVGMLLLGCGRRVQQLWRVP